MENFPEGFADADQLSIYFLIVIAEAAHRIAEFMISFHVGHLIKQCSFYIICIDEKNGVCERGRFLAERGLSPFGGEPSPLVLLTHGDEFVDRMALSGKFFFVLGHDVAAAEGRIVMQVVGFCQKYPTGKLNLFKRELKQVMIVGLKFDYAIVGENLIVSFKELAGGQASFGVSGLGPRIGEIEVYLIYFPNGKYFRQTLGIHTDKADIGHILEIIFVVIVLESPEQDAGISLDSDIVNIRILFCESQEKLSFAHPDLNMDGILGILEGFLPVSTISRFVFYHKWVAGQIGIGSRYITKSHIFFSP